MANVKIRVDTVSEMSGGTWQVGYTIMAGTNVWQPNQTCSGASQAEITAAANAKAAEYVNAETDRQSMLKLIGTQWDTGLSVKWPPV